jgi:glycine C-acetyltransferase
VLDLLEADTRLRDTLEHNAQYFRAGLEASGFDLKPGSHPIIPVMVHDSMQAQRLSQRLLELGVYVVGFFYPVVPKGQARIRVQVSAAHTRTQLDAALSAFAQAGKELGLTK